MAKIEIEGFQNLLDEVAKLGKEGAKIENKALREAGKIVEEAIRNEAPVRTGTLKASIKTSGVRTRGGIKHVEVGPGKEAYYSRFVEFGTVKTRAKPFMEPGFEKSKAQAREAIERELKKGLGL